MNGGLRPKAIVFDFDGTLIDSLSLVLQAIGHAIEPFGPRPEKEILAKLGGPPERFLATLLPDTRHVPTALRRMWNFHQENAHLIRPFTGADQLLARLQARARLAIWTGRDRDSAERLLREHGLADLFATVVCGDDLPTHKPNPDGLMEIMRRLGVTAAETLFVGDADVDVLGGAACGVPTFLIRHGREVESAIAAQACQITDTPVAALEIILRRCELE
jgi:HAD superfamily hydrolase (TIGR01549 family)